jgi:LCP family protein required for cell wall assembly
MRARRVLIGLNVVVALCLAVTAAGYGYVRWQLGRVEHVAIPTVTHADAEPTSTDADRPLTVLLVGSDARKGLPGERSDVILLVRLDPATKTARAMSVPRDLWVDIAGTAKHAKVNAAFAGGPARLVATLHDSLGVDVDHYVQVDFKAFRGVVDALGGVDVPFPAPARDVYSGLDVKRAGCVHLDGDRALQYVRSRHYLQYQDGTWREDRREDLGRIERQHDFLQRLADQADLPTNLVNINRLVSSVVTNLTVDDGFSVPEMTSLALKYRGTRGQALELIELPVQVGRAGGQSVVFLGDAADAAVHRLLTGVMTPSVTVAPTTAPPGGTTEVPPPSLCG